MIYFFYSNRKGVLKKMELVVISQNQCSACRVLETYLNNEYDDLEYTYINIDNEPEYIEKYNVMGTPKVVLLDDDKSVLSSFTGFNMSNTDNLDVLIEQL